MHADVFADHSYVSPLLNHLTVFHLHISSLPCCLINDLNVISKLILFSRSFTKMLNRTHTFIPVSLCHISLGLRTTTINKMNQQMTEPSPHPLLS